MDYKFFDKKTGSGVSVNEELSENSRKLKIKILKKGKFVLGLKIMFGQQI